MRYLAVSLDPNQVSPGLLGFIIVCILGVAVWLLCRNMGKHLTKLDNAYQAEQAELAGNGEDGENAAQDEQAEQDAEESADASAIPAQQK